MEGGQGHILPHITCIEIETNRQTDRERERETLTDYD
jgi:hypothetical protein